MTPCPRCGTEPPEGALFCPSCGERVTPEPHAPAQEADWDLSRPAMPEDLFRRPPEEQPAEPAAPAQAANPAGPDRPANPVGPVPPPSAGPVAAAWGAGDPDATVVRPVVPPPLSVPVPPYRPGSPEADLLPSERQYVAPLPPAPQQRRPRNGVRGVIILLVLLVTAALIGGLVWFTGGGAPKAGPGPSKATSASVAPSRGASAPQGSSLPPSPPPSDTFPPSGASLCSGSTTVAVNAATSCDFAKNVAAAIPAGATGSFTVTASSPVTQKDYQMSCTRGTYTVCSGGVNALVYVK